MSEINTSFTTKSAQGPNRRAVVVGVVAISVWMLLFTGGILVPSAPYRAKLVSTAAISWFETLKAWAGVMAWWTVTNVAFLCSLASLLGGMYRQSAKAYLPLESLSSSNELRCFPYLIQGFMIYMMMISGLVLMADSPFSAFTPERYVRWASTGSVISFLAGYNPRIFARLLEHIEQVTQGKGRPPS